MLEYSPEELRTHFDLSPGFVRTLSEEGHLSPVSIEGTLRYSFRDVLVLRTASDLRRARISLRKIREAFRMLRKLEVRSSPPALTLTLTPAPGGRGIAVSAGSELWSYDSGQYALPLMPAPSLPYAAAEHFERALAIEAVDGDAARSLYAACLAVAPDHLAARIKLGRLLHLAGELPQAARVYREAPHPNAEMLLRFAKVLEEQHRFGEALEKYRHAVSLDPELTKRLAGPSRLPGTPDPRVFTCGTPR